MKSDQKLRKYNRPLFAWVDGKCKKHPRYQAKRRPRCECPTCWLMWNNLAPRAGKELT